jgi:hypothetical protein
VPANQHREGRLVALGGESFQEFAVRDVLGIFRPGYVANVPEKKLRLAARHCREAHAGSSLPLTYSFLEDGKWRKFFLKFVLEIAPRRIVDPKAPEQGLFNVSVAMH